MKLRWTVAVSGFLILSQALASFAGIGPQQRRAVNAPPLLDIVQGLYINRIQQAIELTDDQFFKITGFLKDYLREQYDLQVPRRTRAVNQLRQAINRGASDEELTTLTQEFDRIERDLGTVRQRFTANADPLLQVRQRAKLRLFLVNMENQIRKLIEASQNPAPAPKPLPRH